MRTRTPRPFQFSLGNLLLLTGFVGLFLGTCRLLQSSVLEHNTTPERANTNLHSVLCPIIIPRTATRCTVRGNFNSYCQATFEIDERSFLEWCGKCRLSVTSFETIPWETRSSVQRQFRRLGHGSMQESARGFVFDSMSMRGGKRIVYDASAGRAYVEYAPR
jgi:hypothetical protein